MKILFQEPCVSSTTSYGMYKNAEGNVVFPYGVASLARYVKERGYEVEYLDPSLSGMGRNEYVDYLDEHRFDVIGIGAATLQVDNALETFRVIKEKFPDTVTVMGGIHATLLPEETMRNTPDLDYLVIQEGEKTFFRLLEAINGKGEKGATALDGICCRVDGEVRVNPFDPKDHLLSEEIPIPLFDILPMDRYVAQITFTKRFPTYSVIASRGCPFRCSFCNANDVLGRKSRYKPVSTVLDEIRMLREECGMGGFMFHDSTFTVNRRWVLEFCDAYKKSGLKHPWSCNSRADTIDVELAREMKDAGCWLVSFGIESGTQKSLDSIQKGTTVDQNRAAVKLCMSEGLCVNTNYIICLPGEDERDVLETISFARSLGNHLASFSLPVPYPKTGLANECKKTGVVRSDAAWCEYSGWDFSNPVYINPLIGKERMAELRKKAYRTFYRTPEVLWRNLKELLLFRQTPRKYMVGFRALLFSLRH